MQNKKDKPLKETFQRNEESKSENSKRLTSDSLKNGTGKKHVALPVLSAVLLALARRFSEDPDCSAVSTEDNAATAAALWDPWPERDGGGVGVLGFEDGLNAFDKAASAEARWVGPSPVLLGLSLDWHKDQEASYIDVFIKNV